MFVSSYTLLAKYRTHRHEAATAHIQVAEAKSGVSYRDLSFFPQTFL